MIDYRAFVTLVGILVFCGNSVAQAAEWNVGVGRAIITPSEPTWLSGYNSRNRPAEGIVHHLRAKALAFESKSGMTCVFVTCDLGSIYAELTNRVREGVFQKYGLPREALVINVSHTHGSPEIAAERSIFHAMPDIEKDNLARYIRRQLEPSLIELVGKALEDLKPAQLLLSHSTANFAGNRRSLTKDGFMNQQNPNGVVDHQVPVLQVRSLEGKLRAVMFGYACHNTTLALYQYCGDYAGFAQENIERAHPGVTALFVMGCGGDQNPYPRFAGRGLEYSRQHGLELANSVEEALKSSQTEVHGPLRIASETVTLDLEPLPPIDQLKEEAALEVTDRHVGVRKRKAAYLLEQLKEHGKIELKQECPLLAARFGDQLLFLAFSGETVLDYSIRSKSDFSGPFVWVAGYCDDVFAYLPSLRVLKEGGYEGREGILHQLTPTPFAESVEDTVMGGMHRLVNKVTK